MPRSYPPEFRRKVLDLLAAGRSVTEAATDLGITGACVYNWRKQDRIDRGEIPGLNTPDRAELVAARRRINALEAELAAERRAKALLKEAVLTKGRFAIIKVMVTEGHSIKTSCSVLQVTEAGSFAWRKRAPSERAIRHAWLTDLIVKAHVDSRGTYGARRVHAELTIGRGITVSHGAVELLMRRAGLQGLPNKRRFKTKVQFATARDLVERSFARSEPDHEYLEIFHNWSAPSSVDSNVGNISSSMSHLKHGLELDRGEARRRDKDQLPQGVAPGDFPLAGGEQYCADATAQLWSGSCPALNCATRLPLM